MKLICFLFVLLMAPLYSFADSPNFPNINISDLGRGIKYLDPSIKQSALSWLSTHTDMSEVAMPTDFYFNQPGASNFFTASSLKSLNKHYQTYGYTLLNLLCLHLGCSSTNPSLIDYSSLDESAFLHFYKNTTVSYYALDGSLIKTETIPGCGYKVKSQACRVKVFSYNDFSYVPHPGSFIFKNWYESKLLSQMSDPSNPIDGVFLDAMGPGFSVPLNIGVQTKILTGGNILEYGFLIPRAYNACWGCYNTLDNLYEGDITRFLTELQSKVKAAGKFLLPNYAGYTTDTLTQPSIAAANGVNTEILHGPEQFHTGLTQYNQLSDTVMGIIANGGKADLFNDACFTPSSQYGNGNYSTSLERYRMWRLASYYTLKEPYGYKPTVYLDLNLCIKNSLSFESEWLKAYEVDIGKPSGFMYLYATGHSSQCSYRDYGVFARKFTKGLVLVRPRDDWGCTDYNNSGVTITLPKTMRLLYGDGVLSTLVTEINLQSGEGAVFIN